LEKVVVFIDPDDEHDVVMPAPVSDAEWWDLLTK